MQAYCKAIDYDSKLSFASILLTEKVLLEGLCFDFVVDSPQADLVDLFEACPNDPQIEDCAWSIANDSYRTPLCILYSPKVIAAACYILAERAIEGPHSSSLDVRIASPAPSASLPTPPSHKSQPSGTSRRAIEFFSFNEMELANVAAVTAFSESLAGELDPDWNIKVTVVAPGPFDTGDITKLSIAPPHPAYNNPKLPGMMIRQGFPRIGDAKKAMEVVYKLTELENPPVHFPLGPEAVETFKAKAAAYTADAG